MAHAFTTDSISRLMESLRDTVISVSEELFKMNEGRAITIANAAKRASE